MGGHGRSLVPPRGTGPGALATTVSPLFPHCGPTRDLIWPRRDLIWPRWDLIWPHFASFRPDFGLFLPKITENSPKSGHFPENNWKFTKKWSFSWILLINLVSKPYPNPEGSVKTVIFVKNHEKTVILVKNSHFSKRPGDWIGVFDTFLRIDTTAPPLDHRVDTLHRSVPNPYPNLEAQCRINRNVSEMCQKCHFRRGQICRWHFRGF